MKGYGAVNCTDVGKELSTSRQVAFTWRQVAFWPRRVGLCVWVHVPMHTCLLRVRCSLCGPCFPVPQPLSQLSTCLLKNDSCFPTGHLHPRCLFIRRKREPAVCAPAIDTEEGRDTTAVRGPQSVVLLPAVGEETSASPGWLRSPLLPDTVVSICEEQVRWARSTDSLATQMLLRDSKEQMLHKMYACFRGKHLQFLIHVHK